MTQDEIAIKLTEVEGRAKSNTHRIDDLEKQQSAILDIASSVKVMANEQKHQTEAMRGIEGKVNKLDSKVDTLEKVPGKRWELLVGTVLGALVVYLLAQAGIA